MNGDLHKKMLKKKMNTVNLLCEKLQMNADNKELREKSLILGVAEKDNPPSIEKLDRKYVL